MKLIKIFHKSKLQLSEIFPKNDIFTDATLALSALIVVSAVIWVGGPHLAWGSYSPFASPEKRLYLIGFVFLAWLLKFLIYDLEAPNPFQYKDLLIRKKLGELQLRFNGAIDFLKKTHTTKQDTSVCLNQLPWNILIGPSNSGKTTLLAKSGVHFILQRQFANKNLAEIENSENCDWWITRENSIIDVPGRFFISNQSSNQKINIGPVLWRFFLRLVRKQRGKNGLSGIVLALPLPELMKQADIKKYHAQLRDLFNRMHDIQKVFEHSIPCQIVITKCDLLPGFSDFFAESSNEEITQAWGIQINEANNSARIVDVFQSKFNGLIKKLNQQLLWRLHQERNPMVRPYIKDFPLQIERLKEFTADFIKKLSTANFSVIIEGVYLSSALQTEPEPENSIIDAPINDTQRAVQIFKQPTPASRAYFIKQFIGHGLAQSGQTETLMSNESRWKSRTAYAAAITMISLTGFLMIRDFEHGIQQTYAIQNDLAEYQLAIQQIHEPDAHLIKTLALLDVMKAATQPLGLSTKLANAVSFYTHKSQAQSLEAYHRALKTILIPDVANYLTEILHNPLNHNPENVYGAFKAYLMLGDAAHYQPELILNTLRSNLTTAFDDKSTTQLIEHLNIALNKDWAPMALDVNLIEQMRRYFNSMPSFQLGYTILKNIDSNGVTGDIKLNVDAKNSSIFTNLQLSQQIPTMYTAKAFTTIVSTHTNIAAQEALMGNWVLGDNLSNRNPAALPSLVQQLRVAYVTNYINTWENVLNNIHLNHPTSLAQTHNLITNLISTDSPMLALLQTLHDNTYFDPIASNSARLQTIGLLLDKSRDSANALYQIFSTLQSLQVYVQTILAADDEKRAAFQALAKLMQTRNSPDAITQVRLIADRSPEPIKNWLNKIADDTWHFLLTDAGSYLDISWQTNVMHTYQTEIADRYPFNPNANQEVTIQKFTEFFGNPGVLVSYYNGFLQPFVDTSTPEWRWKTLNNVKLPFSDDTLRQIQTALRINQTFFPNGDKKLLVQFTLQPFKIANTVREVQFNINDKRFIDLHAKAAAPHIFTWPSTDVLGNTSIQLTMSNQEIISRDYPGVWGWFKLVSQSFESVVSKKELLINLSQNQHPVKYLLFTAGNFNPFLSLNLRHFKLSEQLTDNKA